MKNRIVKVLGWGIGTATITAILEGETVFSGKVDLHELTEENAAEQTSPTLFTFNVPMDFSGTKHMKITVEDASVRFGQIVANYCEVSMGGLSFSTGEDSFSDVAEYDSNYVRDPRSNVTIDSMPQKADRLIGKGTWHWIVNPGSTLEHDLAIDLPGMEE